MSSNTKRSLRNTNTCPLVPNPFTLSQTNLQILPTNLMALVSQQQNLSCQQINALPTLSNNSGIQQALLLMKKAAEWQSNGIQTIQQGREIIDEKEFLQRNPIQNVDQHQMLQQVNAVKVEAPMSLYQTLFERELQEFIMASPPPANYDFEYLYYSSPHSPTHSQPQSSTTIKHH